MKFIVELLCLMLAISSCNTKTFHNNSSNLNDTINSDQSNRMDTVHQIENNFSNKKKIIYTDTLPFLLMILLINMQEMIHYMDIECKPFLSGG